MRAVGLTVNTASVVVCLAIATMGLNLLVGFTGLTSFGHSAWFGIGAYAAALAQRHWLRGQIAIPILLSMVLVATLSTVVGILILRRRGVYFSLLTLALAALTYAIAFRWTEVTGGEDGLGGLKRGSIGSVSLDNALAYYVVVAADCARRAVRAWCAWSAPRSGTCSSRSARTSSAPCFRAIPSSGTSWRLRPLGGGDRTRRCAARLPALPRFGRGRLGAVLRRAAGDGGHRRHAPHPRSGAGGALLYPVPRAVLDVDGQLAALVRAGLRRLRPVLAERARRHLGQAAAALASTARGEPRR